MTGALDGEGGRANARLGNMFAPASTVEPTYPVSLISTNTLRSDTRVLSISDSKQVDTARDTLSLLYRLLDELSLIVAHCLQQLDRYHLSLISRQIVQESLYRNPYIP
jgi:hypothetical protein